MFRHALFLIPALFLFASWVVSAQDDGPPIVINSPDAATTFAYGSIKSHVLLWNNREKMLVARVTFTDAEQTYATPEEDTHEFRLPGVTFDAAKGVFFATSAKGEVIPVARIRKTFFIKSIETLPNARIRVLHPRGTVSVILEAISPNDPAMHPAPGNPDATRQVNIDKILN